MTTVYVDAVISDDERRARLYAGDLSVYSPTNASLELVPFADKTIRAAFGPRDPELAQYEIRPSGGRSVGRPDSGNAWNPLIVSS